MANRNRDAGNGYELKVLKKLQDLFPNILTSRNESRTMDGKGVDFVNTGKFNFQCKLSINKPSYDVIERMPEGVNVVIHGQVKKSNKNFVLKEEYAIIKLDEFINLIGSYCQCSEDETTGSITQPCCNICGKIIELK